MMPPDQTEMTRDLSYAQSAESAAGRVVIRAIENLTGRLYLIKRAQGYDADLRAGHDFWQVMTNRFGLRLKVLNGALDLIPREGPLIVVSNHPYGILDGLMMGLILSKRRDDFRILANKVFQKSEQIDRFILPINFDDTKQAVAQNLETRKAAIRYLAAGGAIGIFPGGTVSTARRMFAHPMDPMWRSFTARMVAKSDATVVPVFFTGHTSRLFQIASHTHFTLRLALLVREFRRRVDTTVEVVVGQPIPSALLQKHSGDAREMMAFLRKATYDLSPIPLKNMENGFEFESRYKN